MNAQLFSDISARAETMGSYKFIRVWNNQLELIEQGQNPPFEMPALFVEFISPNIITQLGNGIQLFDPLTVRLHICHWQLDAGNETMEQNLDVMQLKGDTFLKFQMFEPNGCVAWVRTSEQQDYRHAGVYHYIQDYATSFEDLTAKEPRETVVVLPPFDLDINITPDHPYLNP